MGFGNLFVILLYIQLKVLNSNQATKENWFRLEHEAGSKMFQWCQQLIKGKTGRWYGLTSTLFIILKNKDKIYSTSLGDGRHVTENW